LQDAVACILLALAPDEQDRRLQRALDPGPGVLRRLLLCTHSRSLLHLGLDNLAGSHVLTVKALTRLEKEQALRMQGPATGQKPERACDGSDWARAAEIVKEVTAVVTNDESAPA
jgi:hypothetical protein